MKFVLMCTFCVMASALAVASISSIKPAAEKKLAHMVFFTLKDKTSEAREKFVASCQKYLSGHSGVEYFSVGVIAEDVKEPVSVSDFDVALHLVFNDKDSEAKYLKDPRHVKFVDENKEVWEKVRVFDTYVQPEAK